MRKLLSILFFLGFVGSIHAQLIVTDSIGDNPIAGALVRIEDRLNHVSFVESDENGKVELKGEYPLTLYVTSLGYFPFKLSLYQAKEVKVSLNPSVFDIDRAVITGQYDQKIAKEATQRIRVIGAGEIEALNAVTLKDVLILQGNINLKQDVSLGTNIEINGLSGSQVKILVDGVPMIGRLDGNIDLDQINLDEVERIEIVEGPLSVEYGTDALAGTINVITKKGMDSSGLGTARLQYESNNRYHSSVNLRKKLGKNFLRLGLGRNYFDGFKMDDEQRSHLWKPKEQLFANLSWNRVLKKGNLTLKMNAFNEKLYDDGNVNYELTVVPENDSISNVYQVPYSVDAVFTTRRLDNALSYNVRFDSLNSFSVHAAYNYYWRERTTFKKNLDTFEEILSTNSEELDTTAFDQWNSRGIWSRSTRQDLFSFQTGYELQYESSAGKRIKDGEKEMFNGSLFASTELKFIPNLILRPGFRYTYNSSYEAPLIPSFHARWKKDKFTIRASYGKGFRAPSLKELYFFFVDSNHNVRGNDDLEAEVSDSYQASIGFEHLGSDFLCRPTFGVFYNQVSNVIDLALTDFDSQLYNYINLSSVISRGINLNVESVKGNFKVNMAATYLELAQELNNGFAEYNSTYNGQTSISYFFKRREMRFDLRLNHFGPEFRPVYDNDEEVALNKVDSYSLLSVMAHKDFLKKKLKCSLGLNNILNVKQINSTNTSTGIHQTGTGIPVGTGRMAVVSMSYNF